MLEGKWGELGADERQGIHALRLDRGKEIQLWGEISMEGVTVKPEQLDSGRGKSGGKAPTLDLNDLKRGAPRPQAQLQTPEPETPQKQRQQQRGIEWG